MTDRVSLAEMMVQMASGGCTAEQMAHVAARFAEQERARLEKKRADTARRVAKCRALKKAQAEACSDGNALHSVTERYSALQDATSDEHAPARIDNTHAHALIPVGLPDGNPPVSNPPFPTGKTPKGVGRYRGETLPPDWRPSPELLDYGEAQGLTRAEAAAVCEDMRLWAEANAHRPVARKSDWDKTAQGFLRREARSKSARAGPRGVVSANNRKSNLFESAYHEHQAKQQQSVAGNLLELTFGDGVEFG